MCSRFLRIKLRKARFLRETLHKEFPLFSSKTGTTPLIKTSPAWLNAKQKKSRILCIFGLIARKKYQAIRLVGWLVGWLVGCKFYANYLYFCNHFPCLRTFPFQNLHTYLTAIRGDCKVVFFRSCGRIFRCVSFSD